MRKDELLSWLAWWQSFCEQTCDSNICFSEGGDKKRCEQAYEKIVAILKNQPTITEKNIKEWAYEAQYRMQTHKDWGYVADVIKEMLNEIGVVITVDKGK